MEKPQGIRGFFRDNVLDALSFYQRIKGFETYFRRPRVQLLILHHIFKDEEYKFSELLRELSYSHEFITYSSAVDKILGGDIDKPYITFSFDDGFKNNIIAAEILNKFNVKACFFVNPSVIGETNFEKILLHNSQRLHLPPVEQLSWSDVEKLQKQGHEIGSHTMYHKKVTEQSVEEFRDDIGQSLEVLKEYCGEVKHFAYPYGRYFHFTKKAFETVFEAGFQSCASAERGCHITEGEKMSKNDLFLRRDDIIADWDLNHILYFLAQSSRKANIMNNFLPSGFL